MQTVPGNSLVPENIIKKYVLQLGVEELITLILSMIEYPFKNNPLDSIFHYGDTVRSRNLIMMMMENNEQTNELKRMKKEPRRTCMRIVE